MQLLQIYQCFCDLTRLRILHLLSRGPLCVCHFQELLGESQVKISKHLAYLKNKGLVAATKHQNWMIYSLPTKRSPELEKNLMCLQDCVQTEPIFKKDLRALAGIRRDVNWIDSALECRTPALRRQKTGRKAKASNAACC
jgi:ArsR family transcriptional regulator